MEAFGDGVEEFRKNCKDNGLCPDAALQAYVIFTQNSIDRGPGFMRGLKAYEEIRKEKQAKTYGKSE